MTRLQAQTTCKLIPPFRHNAHPRKLQMTFSIVSCPSPARVTCQFIANKRVLLRKAFSSEPNLMKYLSHGELPKKLLTKHTHFSRGHMKKRPKWLPKGIAFPVTASLPCPECGVLISGVLDSRANPAYTRRRRLCSNGHRFTTHEMIHPPRVWSNYVI